MPLENFTPNNTEQPVAKTEEEEVDNSFVDLAESKFDSPKPAEPVTSENPTENSSDKAEREQKIAERKEADAVKIQEIKSELGIAEKTEEGVLETPAVEAPQEITVEQAQESEETLKAELQLALKSLNPLLGPIVKATFLKNLGNLGRTDSERVDSIKSLRESQHFFVELGTLIKQADSYATLWSNLFDAARHHWDGDDYTARAIDESPVGMFGGVKPIAEKPLRKYYELKQKVASFGK